MNAIRDELITKLGIREKLEEPQQELLQRICRTGASVTDEKYLELSVFARDWINEGVKNIKAGGKVANFPEEEEAVAAPETTPMLVEPDPEPDPDPEPEEEEEEEEEPNPEPEPEPVAVEAEPEPAKAVKAVKAVKAAKAPRKKKKAKAKDEPAEVIDINTRRTRRRRTGEQKMQAMRQTITKMLENPMLTKNEAVEHLVGNGHSDTSVNTLAVLFYEVRTVLAVLREPEYAEMLMKSIQDEK